MNRIFFEQNTLNVAQELIGCFLYRKIDEREILVQISETEAYRGKDDPASHAHRGITPRNWLMFGQAGHLYVYFSYGMHYCMNIVTEDEGIPGAVLIRGAIPIKGIEHIRKLRPGIKDSLLINGPGKLTKGLQIDLGFNGYDLCRSHNGLLSIFPKEKPVSIKKTGRIGVSKGQELDWRFVMQI